MLKKLLSASLFEKKSASTDVIFWFLLSLVPTLYFGIVALINAFHRRYVVQDDVRQHVVWLQRFVDPDLFPNDLIADYFESVAPVGYKAFYYCFAKLGIEPLLLAKIIPVILGLIAAIYGFWLAFELFPLPFGAFVSTFILTQSLWLEDDIVTATPRAFVYPIFLAFLYYLLKRSTVPCLIAIALQALFYPQLALVASGILTVRLVQWQRGHLAPSRERSNYLLWLLGIGTVLILVLGFSQDLNHFGPTVTAAQMRSMPEFQPHGRANFFNPNLLNYWVEGDSGLSPSTNPPILWASLFLPLLLKQRHTVAAFVTDKIRILIDILIPSLSLFFIAHLLLLKLYSPSRYTQHSLRVVMAIAAGIAVTIILDICRCWLLQYQWKGLKNWQKFIVGFGSIFIVASIVVPAIPLVLLSGHNQIIGRATKVYEFFAQQPKDIVVASLDREATNLPTFSQRSIFASWEYSLPYHMGYYEQMRQRAIDNMKAQYSPDLSEVKHFIETNGIDFFLIEKGDFSPAYVANNDWLVQYQPDAQNVIDRLKQPPKPVLERLTNQCLALETKTYLVLEAKCVAGAQLK